MNPVFEEALPILHKIEKAGYEAYFVGGSVRDFLMGNEISDIDIATSATPQEIKTIFSRTVDVGIEHGTVVVLFNGLPYEVTTFRTESAYADFRRPDHVSFVRSLEEDLKRRDFTMNAIAMDKNGNIIDPYGGRKDIADKVIRTVGSAKERFQEDALRMMRAVRFVSQLDFAIEPLTYQALRLYGHLLKKISIERIAVEFEKMLLGKSSQLAMKVLVDTVLYNYLPGFYNKRIGLINYYQKEMNEKITLEERWVLLFYYLSLTEQPETVLRAWKLPVKQIKRIITGLNWLKFRLENDWTKTELYQATEEIAISTEKLYNMIKDKKLHSSLAEIKKKCRQLPIKTRKELQITGNDVLTWYDRRRGPWVGEVIEKAEKGVILGKVENRKEAIKEWLFKCNQM